MKATALPLACALAAVAAGSAASAPAAASGASSEALALCHHASLVGGSLARGFVDAGLHLAEAAAAADPRDPVAHFAVFCNLAKRMQMEGVTLGTLRDLRRAHRALDRSLVLHPRYAEALAAKGALLYYSPRFAGGDVVGGERLIRRALAIDPDNPARLVLVELLIYRRAVDEARREAVRSLAVVHASADPFVRAGARALLDHMCAREWPREIDEILREDC